MRKIYSILLASVFTVAYFFSTAFAFYPRTLMNGDLICVDGGQGVGKYADRTSVVVKKYNPPYYQIAINIVPVSFSEEYFKNHRTYDGGPYTIHSPWVIQFRYNWNTKVVSYLRSGVWLDWDINRDYSHAEGAPLIPTAAEVAFVSAYDMKFYGNKMGYSPVQKKRVRVISDNLYTSLGL